MILDNQGVKYGVDDYLIPQEERLGQGRRAGQQGVHRPLGTQGRPQQLLDLIVADDLPKQVLGKVDVTPIWPRCRPGFVLI